MSVIKVKKISKKFVNNDKETKVLDNISLEIEKGEFVSLMGASGSGKSTLLYLIGGLDKPTEGEIYINSKDINKMKEKNLAELRRKDMGFVFQFYNLVQNLSVEENIMLPVIMDGKKEKDYIERLNKILRIIGLEDKRKSLPSELSGGQQQRVSIGRAIINNPAIMLADEPTGNLDSKASEEIISLLRLSNKKYNQTVIIITHDEKIALEADRVITIDDGKIIKDERN